VRYAFFIRDKGIAFPAARGRPAERATRERSTRSARRGSAFIRHFRTRGMALGLLDESQYTYEKLFQGNRHHNFRAGRSAPCARHLTQHRSLPASREIVSALYTSR
jgi:hypothetical protein